MLIALYHLFPRTIHPMVIHFTIAIIYLAALAGFVGLLLKDRAFYARVFLILLCLGVLAAIAAGVAGVISEYYVTIPAGVGHILNAHKRDGELTGVAELIACALQGLHAYRYRKNPRISIPAFVFAVIALVLVSITGSLGGSMVYDHGLGVL